MAPIRRATWFDSLLSRWASSQALNVVHGLRAYLHRASQCCPQPFYVPTPWSPAKTAGNTDTYVSKQSVVHAFNTPEYYYEGFKI